MSDWQEYFTATSIALIVAIAVCVITFRMAGCVEECTAAKAQQAEC